MSFFFFPIVKYVCVVLNSGQLFFRIQQHKISSTLYDLLFVVTLNYIFILALQTITPSFSYAMGLQLVEIQNITKNHHSLNAFYQLFIVTSRLYPLIPGIDIFLKDIYFFIQKLHLNLLLNLHQHSILKIVDSDHESRSSSPGNLNLLFIVHHQVSSVPFYKFPHIVQIDEV